MTEARIGFVSDWMSNGNINEFVKKHPDADRLELVSLVHPPIAFASLK